MNSIMATADNLGTFDVGWAVQLPDAVAFDFLHGEYVDDDAMPLNVETVEALGFDSTLRDVRYPSYLGGGATGGHIVLDGNGLHLRPGAREMRLNALRNVFFASYMLDAEDGIDQDEYDRVNNEVVGILGSDQCERLSEMCTDEHWSPGDMARCALRDDELLVVLDRLDTQEN